jgi:hypothetical protein
MFPKINTIINPTNKYQPHLGLRLLRKITIIGRMHIKNPAIKEAPVKAMMPPISFLELC